MNTVQNVTFGKPKIDGAIFRAPLGTALPVNATTELSSAFACLGYVSEDGVTNSNSPSASQIKAWGGDKVLSLEEEKPDDWNFSLIEALNIDVLKAVYGDSNVTGTLATGITIKANSTPHEASAWVIDMFLRDGAFKRIVIPNGVITEVGDISYKDNDAVGYGIKINAMPGDAAFDYDTHKEYIIRRES